jgi:GntR family galactonate operon transcriptional repressor
VVDKLGLRIVTGDLRPEQILPNESELSTELDVSRTVVREAIKVLAAKGLVEARPKTGTRVMPRVSWNLIDADVLDWQLEADPDEAFFRNLSEVRLVIEPAAAALAAERRTDIESSRLSALVEELDRVVDDVEAYVGVDLALHTAILDATHNELLTRTTDTIATALRASRAITIHRPGGPGSAMALHRAVVRAIVTGDREAARSSMTELVTEARHDLEAVLHNPGLRRARGWPAPSPRTPSDDRRDSGLPAGQSRG